MTISTKTLSMLPNIEGLRRLSQSLALLDAILLPDWQTRYHSFNAHWATDQALASMRDGQGDGAFCLFSPAGAILKGFSHESPMSPYRVDPPHIWPGVVDAVPPQFSDFLSEAAFAPEETTFCIWRSSQDSSWQRGAIDFPEGEDPDGSARLFHLLDGNPRTYQQWAEAYTQRPVRLPIIAHVYQHKPLTDSLVAALNTTMTLQDLAQDIAEIGYQ